MTRLFEIQNSKEIKQRLGAKRKVKRSEKMLGNQLVSAVEKRTVKM
jgi:hypothetical protein